MKRLSILSIVCVTILVGVSAFRTGAEEHTSTPTPVTAPASKPVILSEGTEELPISLPKPLFMITPKNIPADVDRATAVRSKVLAPPGTTNLALKRPVTGSDNSPLQGELSCVTDGIKEGREGCFVELAPGVQWVQIDLGKQATIYGINIWHYHADPRYYTGVVVQVSDDPNFKQATTVFNNDQANENGLGAGKDRKYVEGYEGKLIDAKGVKGRYVRCYSNGSSEGSANHYIEVEVYGK